jgi:hypothetical protein
MTEKENKENRIISQEKTYRQRKQIKQVQIKHQSKKKKKTLVLIFCSFIFRIPLIYQQGTKIY